MIIDENQVGLLVSFRPCWVFIPSSYESKGRLIAPMSAQMLKHYNTTRAVDGSPVGWPSWQESGGYYNY